ncbi:MAG: lysophospholipid acyltransferase family protein [Steroidobacteraceae bacterium]
MTDSLRLRFLYGAMGLAAWLAYRVFGLRRRVIRGNLARSFPDLDPARLRALEREFASRQGEVAAEAFYAASIGEAELRQRVDFLNPGILAPTQPPRPLILVGAHHCNFEWVLQRLSLEMPGRFICLYKPLRNARMDAWMRRLRTRFGAQLIPAKSVLQELARSRDAVAVGLLADQVPRTSPEKHWLEFLGQDTAFYMGPELLARALRTRALLIRMRRLGRGRYELALEPLNEAGEKLANGEITARYARALETWIREDPAGWWWSHRRWKLRRGVYQESG